MAAGTAAETRVTKAEIAVVRETDPTKIAEIAHTDLDQRAEAIKAVADTKAAATDQIVPTKIVEIGHTDLDQRVEAIKAAVVADTRVEETGRIAPTKTEEIALTDQDLRVAEATRAAVIKAAATVETDPSDLDQRAVVAATRVAATDPIDPTRIGEIDLTDLDPKVAEAAIKAVAVVDTRAAVTDRIVLTKIVEIDPIDLGPRAVAEATRVAAVADSKVIAPIDLDQMVEVKAVVTDPIVLTRIAATDPTDLDLRGVEAATKEAVVDIKVIALIDLAPKEAVEAIRAAAIDRIVLTRIEEIDHTDLDQRAAVADTKVAETAPSRGRTETAAMTVPHHRAAAAMPHAETALLPVSALLLPIG